MDTNNRQEIEVENLIGLHSYLKNCLSKLDSKSSKHRRLVIKAIESYVKKYITPAMRLPDTTIDGVVGKEIEGLGLDFLFDSNRKYLTRPSDKEIDEVLEGLAEVRATPQLRNDFWTAWLVREAVICIMSLCNFLEEPFQFGQNTQILANVLHKEIEQLQEILKLPMTGIKANIEILLEKEKEVLAKCTNEPENFITIES